MCGRIFHKSCLKKYWKVGREPVGTCQDESINKIGSMIGLHNAMNETYYDFIQNHIHSNIDKYELMRSIGQDIQQLKRAESVSDYIERSIKEIGEMRYFQHLISKSKEFQATYEKDMAANIKNISSPSLPKSSTSQLVEKKSNVSSDGVRCSYCGAENADGNLFCPHCGNPIVLIDMAGSDSSHLKSQIKCCHCGVENPAGLKYCGKCGEKLAIASEKIIHALNTDKTQSSTIQSLNTMENKFCRYCGKTIKMDSAFCEFCGKAL
jgi:hypothetical protein